MSPARERGKLSPDMRDHMVLGSSPSGKLQRDKSAGSILNLFERSDQRKHGTELIARQIEIENMRASQIRIRQMLDERERNLEQSKVAIKMQKEINAELQQSEAMQKLIKKQHMQNNLEETQRLRELVEIEMTRVAL